MKIKTQLTLGVGLLFVLIALLSLVGVNYTHHLKQDTENILQDNYNSLQYAKNMLAALEDHTQKGVQLFEENLSAQENNVTEIGELEATQRLRAHFIQYSINPSDTVLRSGIRENIIEIFEMNMHAIQRKSIIATSTANRAIFWILVAGILCFIIAFVLLINLPSHIASPIQELTESIKQIAGSNYAQRVRFESHNEFGQLARSFNSMAEKLEAYNNSNLAKLMMEKKRIETLINNMHDPVIGLDEQLNIIFVNEQAIKISGMNEQALTGHNALEIALKNDLIRALVKDIKPLENQANPTKSQPIKIYSDNKEGYFEKEIIHISIVPTGEDQPRMIGHVIFLRNVTEYKELDFAKTNFIATVSHELKTPISSIKMSLQLLENEQIGELNNEQKSLLDSIKDDAGRLLKITSELLNMTQVESGNIQLSLLPTHPSTILNYALSASKTQAEQKQIHFDIDCPENLPLIQADSDKTAWVLTNLISNAIRYSHESATIYLAIQNLGRQVKISVRDTGQGIAPEYIDKIFDRYFRIPGSTKEGTGLGLAISKEFIEAQGGSITVESNLGTGSTFHVLLQAIPPSLD